MNHIIISEIIAFLKYLVFSICCAVCAFAAYLFAMEHRLTLAAVFYLFGSIIWEIFERMRPSWLGWWSCTRKMWFFYLLWPLLTLYFPFSLWRRLHDRQRYWIYPNDNPNASQEPISFNSLGDAIAFARQRSRENNETELIQDHAIWGRHRIEGWGPIHYFVEPTGEVCIMRKSGVKRIFAPEETPY